MGGGSSNGDSVGVDNTSQASLLLRRRHEARHLEALLVSTADDAASRAAELDGREARLQARALELAATVHRFQAFVMESDSKQVKAARREQAEAASAECHKREAAALGADLEGALHKRAEMEGQTQQRARYGSFLERVVEEEAEMHGKGSAAERAGAGVHDILAR